MNLQQEFETPQSQEEPLYQGSKISKILSFVLIVSFVLKHYLSKAAWADLLRLLTALLGERYRRTFQPVYRMKVFMKDSVGSKEPTKINHFLKPFSLSCGTSRRRTEYVMKFDPRDPSVLSLC